MVYPEELNAGLENEALSIITDVIGLDLTKYDAKLYKHNMVSFDNNSPVQESISYILEADESKIRVSLAFINQTLIRWGLSPFNSSQLSPIYSQPLPTNKIEAARDVLERYQAYSKSPIIQEARSILDTVTETETMNITVGNLKMRIIEDENRFSIDWVRIVNGLEFGTGKCSREKRCRGPVR